MTKVIDGKAEAEFLKSKIKTEIIKLKEQGITPGLAVIIVGDYPASKIYVKNKEKSAKEAGFKSVKHELAYEVTEAEIVLLIEQLNQDDSIHGILVQLPLPPHITSSAVINTINPAKDVDGFTETNMGKLALGKKGLVPCTPLGCMILLKKYLGEDLSGKSAVMIGRSNIVGKPMSMLLLKENCTVTIAHSKTKDIQSICRNADIVVAGIGKAHVVNKLWLGEQSVVIDVGINRIEQQGQTKLVGDVDFDEVANHVHAITPVPGGVGPMTIACLLLNTLTAAKQIHCID